MCCHQGGFDFWLKEIIDFVGTYTCRMHRFACSCYLLRLEPAMCRTFKSSPIYSQVLLQHYAPISTYNILVPSLLGRGLRNRTLQHRSVASLLPQRRVCLHLSTVLINVCFFLGGVIIQMIWFDIVLMVLCPAQVQCLEMPLSTIRLGLLGVSTMFYWYSSTAPVSLNLSPSLHSKSEHLKWHRRYDAALLGL